MVLLVGHCSEHDEAVAYLPFVEILENFVDRVPDPDRLREALGDQAPRAGAPAAETQKPPSRACPTARFATSAGATAFVQLRLRLRGTGRFARNRF